MTYDAKEAIRKCRPLIYEFEHAIDDLKEPSLKAFIAEAEGNTEGCNAGVAAIWTSLADAAQHRLAVLKARRSLKGIWVAEATLTTWEAVGREVGHSKSLETRRCNGQKAAVAAAQEMLRVHADRFGACSTIDVDIMPEIEWCSEDGDVDDANDCSSFKD